MYDYNEDDYSYLNQSENEAINANDLIIIDNPEKWQPTDDFISAYAFHLGFDILNDPPELIDIAKKYLLKPLPPNFSRAFRKDDLKIYYIDNINNEVHLESEIDKECKNEYEMLKLKLKSKKEKKKKRSSKSKSKKKKKKKSNKSSEHTSNEEDEKEKNGKKEEKSLDEKNKIINLLKKKKEKYNVYKEKYKEDYIKKKKESKLDIKEIYEKKIIIKKRKLIDLEIENLKNIEIKLEKGHNENIDLYRKEQSDIYQNKFNKNSTNNQFIEESIKLKVLKEKLQKEILLQKEKNNNKLEVLKQKAQNKIDSIIDNKKEILKNKYKSLDEINNIKISKIQKKFNKEYEKYINEIKLNNTIYNINNSENENRIKKQNNIRLNQYKKEMMEEYEKKKDEIKNELEIEHQNELRKYEKSIIELNNIKSIEIKENMDNLAKNYYEELEDYKNKTKSKDNLLKDNDFDINNIKSKYDIEKMLKGADDLINNIIYEDKIEETVNEEYNELYLKLNQIKSLYDLSERQFVMKHLNIEFYKDLILLLTKKIIENNTIGDFIIDNENQRNRKSKDTPLINELIIDCEDLINKYSTKFENQKNQKLFNNLENKFKKLKQNNYNSQRNEKSYYEQSSKNYVNQTILLGDIKNLLFKNNNKSNLNKTHNFININNTINDKSFIPKEIHLNQSSSLSTNKNISRFRNLSNVMQQKPNNLFKSPPTCKSNKSSNKFTNIFRENMNSSNRFDSYEKRLYNINDNSIINYKGNINSNENIKENRNNYINDDSVNNNNKINNENIYKNMNNDSINNNKINNENKFVNYELIKLPKLNENILSNISDENYYLYNKILDFLSNEFHSLNILINNIKNKSINQKLYSIKESIYFNKFKNIFEQIYNIENEKSQDLFNKILISKNNLDNIKNECDILFNDINSGQYNLDNIRENFNNILQKIEIYKNNNIEKYNNINSGNINQVNLNNNDLYGLKKNESKQNHFLKHNNFIEEKKDNIKNRNFVDFYSSYNPNKLSKKFNNTLTHKFFNFKKNNKDLKFKLISYDV